MTQEKDKREATPEAAPEVRAEPRAPPGLLLRRGEPPQTGLLRPLQPMEPLRDEELVERMAEALAPSRIVPPLLPEASPPPPLSMRGREPLGFRCPYGLGGQCCGCRYAPCRELVLAVLGYVSRDYSPGGRCAVD